AGVQFKGASTQTILMKNMLIYGIGGMIVPFVGIKLIDLANQFFIYRRRDKWQRFEKVLDS
ncbi:hypothetical protein WL259_13415, partial [Staphylococcus epidermidis]|uniref:hypothetical protein n=1 Tax=Staphylococcus epidermidis TaxID=1282 RepID=UPI0030BEBBF5